MKAPINKAWGKLKRGSCGGLLEWHPLVDHALDVAAVVDALLLQPTIRRRLSALAGSDVGDVRIRSRLCALSFLHDLGKANSGFQAKSLSPEERRLRGIAAAGHVDELRALFFDEALLARFSEVFPLEEMESWGDGWWPLLWAAVSHHGRPVLADPMRVPNPGEGATFWRPMAVYDPFQSLAELGAGLFRWFPAAMERGGPLLPTHTVFQHAFAGLVQLADWLGSHTGFFPYSDESESDHWSLARRRAAVAVTAVGLAVEQGRAAVIERQMTFSGLFADRGLHEPSPLQSAALRRDLGDLVVIEGETGSGKTEAALLRFKSLFEAGQVDGLYFALPTRAAASQIFARVRAMVAALFPEAQRPVVVQALPGYVKADEAEFRLLPGFETQWTDNPSDAEAHRRWAAEGPKRFLAAQIAVGTIDQALLAALQVRHAHLRLFALSRQLLVVDEVHASDPYMTKLLSALLDVHRTAGGQALLMSATLGATARCSYLGHATPAHELAVAVPYPRLSGTKQSVAIHSTGRQKRVAIQLLPALSEPATVAKQAVGEAAVGAKVLIIRNTVAVAVETQAAVEKIAPTSLLFSVNGVPAPHHSRFAREDRSLLDAAVERCLGKTRPDGPMILIGTQTLEQSLDIDADLLITDLCPMDVLLQRLGRLHRHERDGRAAGVSSPRAIVLVPSNRDLSSWLRGAGLRYGLGPGREGGGIYPDLAVIEATWRALEARIELAIPSQNRALIEDTTHPDALQRLACELGAEWEAHRHQMLGIATAQAGVASIHKLPIDREFGTWTFPEMGELVRTRLGADDRVLDLGGLYGGPFNEQVRRFSVPPHLMRDLANDAVPSVVAREGVLAITWGDIHLRYDRWGLRRE